MTRTILSGLLAVISVAGIALTPLSCQSGGVGDPCTPEDEYLPQFSGFKVTEDNVESRSFQCDTRICLVNHFQGRVSCPLGQSERPICNGTNGPDPSGCTAPATCVEADTSAPDCTDNSQCTGYGPCNKAGKFCECPTNGAACPKGYVCDAATNQCKNYVCHTKLNCQTADGTNKVGQDCCVPGSDTPVTQAVCGQCSSKSSRDAAGSVYCSCRCGNAEGDPTDPNFNFCSCPSGFECQEIRKDLGDKISDPQLTGKYCIKSGSVYKNDLGASCGGVKGHFSSICAGSQSN